MSVFPQYVIWPSDHLLAFRVKNPIDWQSKRHLICSDIYAPEPNYFRTEPTMKDGFFSLAFPPGLPAPLRIPDVAGIRNIM
jgi:hypothetical protein